MSRIGDTWTFLEWREERGVTGEQVTREGASNEWPPMPCEERTDAQLRISRGVGRPTEIGGAKHKILRSKDGRLQTERVL